MKELVKTINSERRLELRRDKKYLHIMKYMGSKRELLPDIRNEIEGVLSEGSGILDLFAGTGSVGMYLKDKYNIFSNDIQSYSETICNALIVSSKIKINFEIESVLKKLEVLFEENNQELSSILSEALKQSEEFTKIPKRSWTNKARLEYIQFFEEFPSPTNEFKTKSKELKKIYALYQDRADEGDHFPYCQTTFLFSETYFSLKQAIHIDSIRYAIDKLFKNEIEKSIALTALTHAFSYCSSGTGHFAMFRDLKSVASINDVFLYRDKSVWSFFENKFREVVEFHNYAPDKSHKVYNLDCFELLKKKSESKKYDLIYADPPYSFVHYSRFYHAVESLIKYDYQIPEHKGRYRIDRHQSPFCQKLNVKSAFNELFELAALNKKIVLLSYSDAGMISIEDICNLAKNNGFMSKIKIVNYDHSTMGRSGHKSNTIKEYLITFKPCSEV